ncbi:MAG: hypothetical protein LUI14_07260 [Lachnospiraceae bacterium]|nr:hypothetical protein [Lachnospiraceae bacterium]
MKKRYTFEQLKQLDLIKNGRELSASHRSLMFCFAPWWNVAAQNRR